MAEVGRFSQRISLEGLEEIKKGLEEIGLTGTKAFKEVERAVAASNTQLTGIGRATAAVSAAFVSVGASAKSLGTSVAGVGTAFAAVGSSVAAVTSTFARFGAAAIGLGTVGGIAGATAALIAFTKASAEAGDDVNKVSQALGLSVEQYQALSFAAAQAGVDQQQFGRAMSNLNKLIQDGVKEQNKALFDFATSVKEAGGVAVRTLTDNAFQVGASFQQIADAARNVQAQLQGRGIELPLNSIIAALERLSRGSIEQRKQFELLAGGVDLPRTALQQLGLDADKSGNALLRLGVRLTDATGKTRNTGDIFKDIADKLTAIQDPAIRSATAIELFTQRAGPRLIPLLAKGRAGIEELTDEFSKMATGFTKEGAQAAEDVNDAFSSMFTTIKDVRNQLAVPLFRPLEAAARAVQGVIQANRTAFDELGKTIAAKVIPVIQDFILLITGRQQDITSPWIKGMIAFGAAVQAAINVVVIPAFNALSAIVNGVAAAINALFGTKLTGADVFGIGAITLAFGGLLSMIANVVIAIGALVIALGRLAAHPVILTLTVLAATIGNLVGIYQDLTRTVSEHEKKQVALTKALRDGEITQAQYNQRMKELDAGTTATSAATGDQTQKIAALTAQWQAGTITAQEYNRQIQALTGTTTAAGVAAQNSTIAVREVGAAAAASGIQVRQVAAAAAASTAQVQAAATATQQATTQAATGLATVEAEAIDVGAATAQAEQSMLRFSTISFNPITIALTALINLFIEATRRAEEAARAAQAVGSGGGGGGGGGFAHGGFVRGPGTATSDSILARLSSGEFVIRAAAVRHFGAEFFAALNALRTPRFNMGGLVDGLNRTLARNFTVPGFAMGGPAVGSTSRGDLRPVIINIGGRQIAGLLAPPDVVQELRRAAISEQYLSAGRKTL